MSLRSLFPQDELLNAFFIKSVKPGSVAEKSGFEADDRIYEITHAGIPTGKDQKPLVFRLKGKTLDVVMAELKRGIATGKPVQMKVRRLSRPRESLSEFPRAP
jgi:C-terminal processing protease CtpA/Prc